MNVNLDEYVEEIEIFTLKNNFDESVSLLGNYYCNPKINTSICFDCISNEMIKNCSICSNASIKLFNLVSEFGIFPAEWTDSSI